MHRKVLLEAVTSLAQARVPLTISSALMRARFTALKKPDGEVRGIATGALCDDSSHAHLRNSSPKTLRRSVLLFNIPCPTDTDPQATILSVDGVGAYDHVEVFRIETEVRICQKVQQFVLFFSWQEQDAQRASEILGIGEN